MKAPSTFSQFDGSNWGRAINANRKRNLMARSDSPKTDAELMRGAQQGDLRAFETLIRRYDERVLSMALRYAENEDDAKDLYQEIFLRAYRGLEKFERRCEFSTWLYQIAINACLTYAETKRKSRERGNAQETEDLRSLSRAQPSPELALQVEEALSALSPNQKMAFLLKHYEGYSIKEIAAMMNCAEGTIKKHLSNAIDRLQRLLKGVSK